MPELPNWTSVYPHAKKVLIWGVFFLLLYVLRDLFALVFFTFILAFVSYRISEYAVEHLDVTRRFAISFTYLILILALLGLGYLIVPRVFKEARQFARDLPDVETKITQTFSNWRTKYTEFAPILNTYAEPDRLDRELAELRAAAEEALPQLIREFLGGLMTVVFSIVFSFLIVIDLARLRRDIKRLRETRLHDFIQETARPIVTFGRIVGRAFEAQIFIALVNTLLTVLGMLLLGIPKVALLGIVVFLFSFIPVLGVILSSVPIMLVAFNAEGFWLAFLALGMVLFVHAVEAYVINPRIYAEHMKMNPVLVLIVLFLGHHLFGVWGVLLAVPVTHYFITHVAGLKPASARRRRWGRGSERESADVEPDRPETPWSFETPLPAEMPQVGLDSAEEESTPPERTASPPAPSRGKDQP